MPRPLGCARRSVPIGPQWQPGSIGQALGAFPWIQQSLALTWRQDETHAAAFASSQILTLRSSIRFAAGAAPPKPHLGVRAGGAGSQRSGRPIDRQYRSNCGRLPVLSAAHFAVNADVWSHGQNGLSRVKRILLLRDVARLCNRVLGHAPRVAEQSADHW
jgi:hypothetical protein